MCTSKASKISIFLQQFFLWQGKENFILPIYSQEKSVRRGMVSSLAHFKEGSTSRAVKKREGEGGIHMGNTIKYFARSGCMAWKGGARREGLGLPCPAWRWQFRFVLKFVVFSPPPRGGRTIYVTKLRYTLRCSASPPSPSPKEMSFPHRNRVEGGFGRKVGCGCLRSAWSGNVIIFGRDKAKIAFMDHQDIYI